MSDGSQRCFGNNDTGKLGLGDTDNRGDDANEMGSNLASFSLGDNRMARAFFGNAGGACALMDNSKVRCWGDNGNGEHGLEDTTRRGDGANAFVEELQSILIPDVNQLLQSGQKGITCITTAEQIMTQAETEANGLIDTWADTVMGIY